MYVWIWPTELVILLGSAQKVRNLLVHAFLVSCALLLCFFVMHTSLRYIQGPPMFDVYCGCVFWCPMLCAFWSCYLVMHASLHYIQGPPMFVVYCGCVFWCPMLCALWLCFLVAWKGVLICMSITITHKLFDLYEHHYHSQLVWFVWASLSLITCLICMSITFSHNLFNLYEHHFFSQFVWFVWASLFLTICLICKSITFSHNLFDSYEHHFFSQFVWYEHHSYSQLF